MGWILKQIAAYFTKNPAKLAEVSKVAGKQLTTPAALVNWAKGSKVNMALTAASMGSTGLMVADFIKESGDLTQQVDKILARIEFVPDELAPDAKLSLDDLDKYKDELAMIRRCASRMGGMERLLELRTVLALPNQYFELEQAVKRLAR